MRRRFLQIALAAHPSRTAKKLMKLRRLAQPSKEARDYEAYHIAAWQSGCWKRQMSSAAIRYSALHHDRYGSDSEWLAMSTTGPLNPEQQTRGKTLDEFCVGP